MKSWGGGVEEGKGSICLPPCLSMQLEFLREGNARVEKGAREEAKCSPNPFQRFSRSPSFSKGCIVSRGTPLEPQPTQVPGLLFPSLLLLSSSYALVFRPF